MTFRRWIVSGLCCYAVLCACLVDPGGAMAADAKEKPADREPPLEFSLELGAQAFEIREGEPVKVKVGDKELPAKLTAKPTRLLDLGEISLRYPREYTFEHTKTDARTAWTLSGNRNWFKLTRYGPGQAPPKSLEIKADEFERALNRGKLARSPVRYSLAAQPVEALRTQWQHSNSTFRADFLFLKAGGSTYELLIFDQSNTADVTDETRRVVKLLEESLKVQK
jgi:hypothetical protein